ncbi:MAG: TetR/AcrR family transcriptional regulator [Rhodobacteraceae bacterium]|nr:TetR/AcrR family transcriptional regulator [Paracoccaceae bacterium]
MTRQLEFDESEALTAAMHAFRRRGYSGVSIKTLEAETGLSSGSIYNSFGSKDAVFGRVLHHYNDTVVEKRIAEHLDGAEPTEGLISLFESLLDEPDDRAFGCLLTNSAVEFAGPDTIASVEIRRGFDRFLSAFGAILMNVPDANPDAVQNTSLRLLAYYQGLLVLIRHGYDKAALRDTIKSEIKVITGDLDA